jgi:3-(3-hydroxy-phenyl)propionate hydroxylase
MVAAAAGSELECWLRDGGATLAVVRPDRAVMLAGKDVQKVCDTMPKLRVPDTMVTETEVEAANR